MHKPHPNHPPAITLLRHAVTLPWESLDQALKQHVDAGVILGDATTPGTAHWHLRHITEIFQLHSATLRGTTPPSPDALPTDPRALRDLLLADINTLDAWLTQQDHAFFDRPVIYGRSHSFLEMVSVMLQHITWHAAAVHYWVCWRRDQA